MYNCYVINKCMSRYYIFEYGPKELLSDQKQNTIVCLGQWPMEGF